MLGERIHSAGTLVLSVTIALLGIGLVVEAIGGDGGVFSIRLLLGILMIAAGVGRIYVLVNGRPRS